MRRLTPGRAAPPALAALLLAALLTGCGSSYDDYCAQVSGSQQQLGEAFAGGRPADLIAALPTLEQLQGKAPGDVRGEWDQLVGAIEGLRDALQAAGVDPTTYDGSGMPPGLTAAQKARIRAAATGLESRDTLAASSAVQQEARDVCHTPLSL